MLHDCVVVGRGLAGRGLIATREISEGEVVWKAEPTRIYSSEDRARLPPVMRRSFDTYAYQVDEDAWAYTHPKKDPSFFMNHSCEPNCWHGDDDTFIARREIKPGEELTFDYGTTESDPEFSMTCGCGAATCRLLITGRDHEDPVFQEKYAGHMMSYLMRRIALKTPDHLILVPIRRRARH